MKLEGHECNNCGKITFDVYTEKGWIFFDEDGTHITNGKVEGRANVEIYFTLLKFVPHNNSLDLCSLKCFLEWLFLSDKTSNKHSPMEERKKFMQTMFKKSRLKFY